MTEEEICKLYLNPDKGNNYISKDKIRDIIKDLDEFDTDFYTSKELKLATKNSLKELLEEK